MQLTLAVHKTIESRLDGEQRHEVGNALKLAQSTLKEKLWNNELNYIFSNTTRDHFITYVNWHDILLNQDKRLCLTSTK